MMTEEELRALHWQQLKKMVEDAGLEYKGKDQAVEALLALQPATDELPADAAAADAPADAADAQPVEPAAVRLNRAKPYGDVFGDVDGAPGARFIQDGTLFNAKGEKVG